MTDARAIGAVARIISDGIAAEADPEVIAAHVITALRGHGWRPTNVVPLSEWHQSPPLAENVVHAYAARARQAITRDDT